jgi:gliding motility-associated protein GldL
MGDANSNAKIKSKHDDHATERVKGFKRFLYLAACIGSAVVIVGALFKIMHWPGAAQMLIIGLLTEAAIFLLYAIDIPYEDVDWSLAYPILHKDNADRHPKSPIERKDALDNMSVGQGSKSSGNNGALELGFANMIKEANIDKTVFEDLGKGMRSLSENASKIADISKAQLATNEYVDSVKNASQNVSHLADTYKKAADSISDLAQANDAGTSIGGSLNSVAKNLSALNATYELQLQGSQEHLKATSKFYDGLNDLMKNLSDSVDDTKKYKEEIATLSKNLNSLNTIYGNMLTAMNFKNNA